jgi:hypothetical protein
MTNEEHLEEILYQAHALGIVDELTKRVPANVEYSKKTDVYLSEMLKIIGEKDISLDH